MTVVYTGANDMLHAFRAGPSCATGPSLSTPVVCAGDNGGQELWGFVPYDQLVKLHDRYRDFPESKTTKNYMIAVAVVQLRSEEHTSELQSHSDLVCRLLLEKKKKKTR